MRDPESEFVSLWCQSRKRYEEGTTYEAFWSVGAEVHHACGL